MSSSSCSKKPIEDIIKEYQLVYIEMQAVIDECRRLGQESQEISSLECNSLEEKEEYIERIEQLLKDTDELEAREKAIKQRALRSMMNVKSIIEEIKQLKK